MFSLNCTCVGTLDDSVVEHLPSTQGVILESQDWVPHWVPCMEPASLSAYVSACVCVCVCVSWINKFLKIKKKKRERERRLCGSAVERLPLSQGVISESRDPGSPWSPASGFLQRASFSLCLCLCLSLSVSHEYIKSLKENKLYLFVCVKLFKT